MWPSSLEVFKTYQHTVERGAFRELLGRTNMLQWVLKAMLGTQHEREIKRLRPMVEAINRREAELAKLSDAGLQAKTAELKQKLANGASLDDLRFDAFAALREASKRALGMRHYDVQLVGGLVLHEGKIAEMKTGEGKTLVATLPCYLNALEGRGVHVVTVNDYLAKRDAEWMSRVYNFMGMSVGVVVPDQASADKARAYRCDITYGQNNEIGFDYLRDNMKFSIYDYAQRPLRFAIVDEVDSILIDEARTPLIISGAGHGVSEKYTRISDLIPSLHKVNYCQVDEKSRTVSLTEEGVIEAQRLLKRAGITRVENLYEATNLETLHVLNQCLRAHVLYRRDRDYMVTPDRKVLIIDEFTGRALAGRRWSEGLHQAVEAKEHVPIEEESRTLATISFQNLFRLYDKLAGMTGTADTEAAEFKNIYKLQVVVVPTNKPTERIDGEDRIYRTESEKLKAVTTEIEECYGGGQPVLVGTTSVEKSEALSQLLTRKRIPHKVLSAKQHEHEAAVIAQAGRTGAVTVATNMAGRGTDILLGGNPGMLARVEVLASADDALRADRVALEQTISELAKTYQAKHEAERKAVIEAGGLHIIGTERHESRRIDNQLRGRAGRQGDQGSSRFFLSLDDDLCRISLGERAQQLAASSGVGTDQALTAPAVGRAVETAQAAIEQRNFDARKHMLDYDDVMNQQRRTIYGLRREVLEGRYRAPDLEAPREAPASQAASPELAEQIRPVLRSLVDAHSQGEVSGELERDVYEVFGCVLSVVSTTPDSSAAVERMEREVGLALTEQRERLLDMTDDVVSAMIARTCPANLPRDEWDMHAIASTFEEQFGFAPDQRFTRLIEAPQIAAELYAQAEQKLLQKERELTPAPFLRLFRLLFLQEIDKGWLEHLGQLDHVRDGIGLRGYGQLDPKKEYAREALALFTTTLDSIRSEVLRQLCRVERVTEEELRAAEVRRGAPPASPGAERKVAPGGQAKVGRNEPCPCGSGKKYKSCHLSADLAGR
jgi:preprotein translocase subunit SecA